MTLDEKISAEIYNEIMIDLVSDYKRRFQNKSFYQQLNEEDKQEIDILLERFAVDIVSTILGGLDGSTKLGHFFGGFSVHYEGENIFPSLQDNFLGFYEDDFDKKHKIIVE
ncbi:MULTISPECIES: hypothetical protein [unclassified Acinetobacter]|uniref:hypothetical protein n=1 Tax=unclassified Acinetobacter TaxID=196816 RepID=UPI0035B79D3F